jgi:hypothetical protein
MIEQEARQCARIHTESTLDRLYFKPATKPSS